MNSRKLLRLSCFESAIIFAFSYTLILTGGKVNALGAWEEMLREALNKLSPKWRILRSETPHLDSIRGAAKLKYAHAAADKAQPHNTTDTSQLTALLGILMIACFATALPSPRLN